MRISLQALGQAAAGAAAALFSVCALVFALAFAFSPQVCTLLSRGGESGAQASVAVLDRGVLRLDGVIDPAMEAGALKLIADSSAAIRAVSLHSDGGQTQAAAAIGRALYERFHGKIPVAVEAGHECLSACVLVLLGGEPALAGDSLVLFHAVRLDMAVEGCAFCRFVARHDPRLALPPAQRDAMLTWASMLSPRLGEFLESCPGHPVSTAAGVALTGAQIMAIEDGRADFTCAGLPSSWAALAAFRRRHPEAPAQTTEAARGGRDGHKSAS